MENEKLYNMLKKVQEPKGYYFSRYKDRVFELLEALIINKERYGYMACPCRLASADKAEDMDIICPCDYRDADINEFDNCYCALYVSAQIAEGKKEAGSIPERRPSKEQRNMAKKETKTMISELPLPVWRCTVCGYLCARDEPPEVCPICKAEKERFQRFI